MATELITFETRAVHERSPAEIKFNWNAYNLTANTAAAIRISLYGYREPTIHPELKLIDILEVRGAWRGEAWRCGALITSPPRA